MTHRKLSGFVEKKFFSLVYFQFVKKLFIELMSLVAKIRHSWHDQLIMTVSKAMMALKKLTFYN